AAERRAARLDVAALPDQQHPLGVAAGTFTIADVPPARPAPARRHAAECDGTAAKLADGPDQNAAAGSAAGPGPRPDRAGHSARHHPDAGPEQFVPVRTGP